MDYFIGEGPVGIKTTASCCWSRGWALLRNACHSPSWSALARAPALVEVGVAPEVDVLVQHAELRREAALELSVLIAADLAADLGVELQVVAELARVEGVGPQLVDHGELLSVIIGRGRAACRGRSPCAADDPPSPEGGGSAAGRDARRTPRRAGRSTRARASRRRDRGR